MKILMQEERIHFLSSSQTFLRQVIGQMQIQVRLITQLVEAWAHGKMCLNAEVRALEVPFKPCCEGVKVE